MRKSQIARAMTAFTVAVSAAVPAGHAEPLIGQSRNTYAMPGLIDMPTAEARPDGELGVSIMSFNDGTMRNTLTFQIAPRITGAFRYSRVPGLMPKKDKSGALTGTYEALYDRSFDIRWEFLDEGRYTPAMAVGLRDFVGTGVYSSEYLVATKSFGPKLRFTGGLGWGRLGTHGGFSGWGTRPTYDYSSTGGKFNSGSWFKGDIAPFFGVSYKLNDKLTLKAEYSSDDYVKETQLDGFDRRTSVNFAADYQFSDTFGVQLYYLYGSKVGFQFVRNIDPHKPPFPSGIERAPLPVKPRPSPAADPEGWSGAWTADPTARPVIQKVLADSLRKDGQILQSMSLTKTRAELRVQNETYGAQPQAIGHVARVATRALPSSVETIVITSVERGMPVSSITFRRSDLEKLENTRSGEILSVSPITEVAPNPDLVRTEGLFPRFEWAATPYAEASIFDPDDPFRLDVGLALSARYEFAPGFVLSGLVRQKAFGNLGDSTRVSDSLAPHVRSDLVEYQKNGDLAVQNLQLAYYMHPASNIYTRVTAGYLERMYGGVSGEVLWKPVDSRLALGLEANWVKQRDFDQHFGFQSYSTVTGHASAYYDFGKGYVGELDVGRYLAQDWGATLSLDREFENGWKVGAFATLTDMSTKTFGEGSFDKGIRLTIPVAWTTGKPSVNKLSTTIRPLQRDGGARLDIDGRLYDTVRGAQSGDLYASWGRFWR